MRTTSATESSRLLRTIPELEDQKRRIVRFASRFFPMLAIFGCLLGIISFVTPISGKTDRKMNLAFLCFFEITFCGIGIWTAITAWKKIKNIDAQLEELRGNPRQPLLPMTIR